MIPYAIAAAQPVPNNQNGATLGDLTVPYLRMVIAMGGFIAACARVVLKHDYDLNG